MTFAGAIFDLDGTLANTLGDIAAAANAALGALGCEPHEAERYRPWIGEGIVRLMERALPTGSAEKLLEPAVEEFKRSYAAHLVDRTRPYPGVTELLAELTARGVPFAVLSNKPDAATKSVVDELFPALELVAAVGYQPGVPRKPDPTSALALAVAMKVEPARCALVGDTATDMKTAVAAGMIPIAVTWGFRDRDELVATGAQHVVDTAPELLELLTAGGGSS